MSNRTRRSSSKLDSPTYSLPPRAYAPKVIRLGLYNWELPPLTNNVARKIILTCTRCPRVTRSDWPLNSTNLKNHYKNAHPGVLRNLHSVSLSTNLPERDHVIKPNLLQSADMSTQTIDNFYSNNGTFHENSSEDTLPLTIHQSQSQESLYFDPEKFKSLFMEYLLANDLPFSFVENPYLTKLLSYATLCEDSELPNISYDTMESKLVNMYNNEFLRLKLRLAEHKGRFSLTFDEWKSMDKDDFFAVTVHFHNEQFVLEHYTIGFEVLNHETSYTGWALFERFDQVLVDYDIKNRIVSITRDDSGPINTLLDDFNDDIDEEFLQFYFSGNIRCTRQMVNQIANTFLDFTFMKTTNTDSFYKSLRIYEEKYPEFTEFFLTMRNLPKLIKSIITDVLHNSYLRKCFHNFVKHRNSSKEKKERPELLLSDEEPGWFSTYKMLDRFLYFRKEISRLLQRIQIHPKDIQDELKIKVYEISELEWKYLQSIRDILAVFLTPTEVFRGCKCPTGNLTIPYMSKLLSILTNLKTNYPDDINPYIALGLLKACDELNKYYPMMDADIKPLKSLYLATVLDPRLKLKIFEVLGFSKSVIDQIKQHFLTVYADYKLEYEKEQELDKSKPNKVSDQSNNQYDLMCDIFIQDDTIVDDNEVSFYLTGERENGDVSIGEYYQNRKRSLPVIGRMAKDFLSIMAMSAPVESLVTQLKNLVTDGKNGLQASRIKLLAVLKSRGIIKGEYDEVHEKETVQEMNSDGIRLPMSAMCLKDFKVMEFGDY